MPTGTRPTRIVIVGAGFAGTACARGLARRLSGRAADVTVVDRNNYLLFTPLLVEAGVGRLEPRHVTVPVRQLLPGVRFLRAEVAEVDLEAREISCRATGRDDLQVVSYDHLVVAVGSITGLPRDPAMRDHLVGLQDLTDAIALRERMMRLLEVASASVDRERRRELLHVAVVGGSYAGVEVAGEYHALLRRASAAYPDVDAADCRVTLVEKAERLLSGLDTAMADYAAAELRRAGVEVRLGVGVTAAAEDGARLSDGTHLAARTLVWCAGVAPNPLIAQSGLPVDARGWVPSRPDLGVPGLEGVWAIGDCAMNPDPEGRPYPPTGQHASRLGAHAARNIAARLRGRATTPVVIRDRGTLVPLGPRTAVARALGRTWRGAPALALTRAVYLAKMPGLARKARIALAWALDLASPPPAVHLRLPRPETIARGARATDGD
jgi:NADH dehydrogenase